MTRRIDLGKHVRLESVPTAAVIKEIESRKARVFEAHVAELRATAQAEVPVHSRPHHGHLPGRLKATIRAGVSRKGDLYLASGGPGGRHAPLVEHGTKNMSADPFMARTIGKVNRSVGSDLKRELGRPL